MSGDDGEPCIRPIGRVLTVLRQPAEDVLPEFGAVHDRNGYNPECGQEPPEPLALNPMRKVEARFREDRLPDHKHLTPEPIEMADGRRMKRVPRVA